MARGINKVILIGNLGADPETRAMPSGTTVANLRVATSESWRDKQTGEQQERTEWHRVALFGRLAEVAGEYLRKGSQVYIEEACERASGRTSRATSATRPRSLATICRCSVDAAVPVARVLPRCRPVPGARALPPMPRSRPAAAHAARSSTTTFRSEAGAPLAPTQLAGWVTG